MNIQTIEIPILEFFQKKMNFWDFITLNWSRSFESLPALICTAADLSSSDRSQVDALASWSFQVDSARHSRAALPDPWLSYTFHNPSSRYGIKNKTKRMIWKLFLKDSQVRITKNCRTVNIYTYIFIYIMNY